jgi:uncharacterized protein (TIGR04255 family)
MDTDRMRQRYANPPLVEAVVEFQFVPGGHEWDSVFFGEIRSALKEMFPEIENVAGADIHINSEGATVTPAPELKRFLRTDRGMAVTVGAHVLGVSVLPPNLGHHPGWQEFLGTALRVLDVYLEVVHPSPVQQIGVRYVNVLEFGAGAPSLESVVSGASGLIPLRLTQSTGPFTYRFEHIVGADEAGIHREALQIAGASDPSGALRLIVDIDQIWNSAGGKSPDLIPVCNMLHDQAYKLFAQVFTSKMRRLFHPVRQ